jgi:hypothetical protein
MEAKAEAWICGLWSYAYRESGTTKRKRIQRTAGLRLANTKAMDGDEATEISD